MILGLAGFVMGARWRAISVAAATAAAALLLPPLTSPLAYLGAAVVALVTLRLGAWEGLMVLAAAAVALALLGQLAGGLALPMALSALVLWLPVWGLGAILRLSRSLALALQAAAGLGVALVLLAHLWLGDPAAWWAPRIEAMLAPLLATQDLDIGAYLPELARWMTALSVAALVLGVLLSLLLARAWQAALYNPGGFGDEFRGLRLGRGFALAGLAVIVLAQLPVAGLATLAADAVPTLLVVYLLQGLALAHAAARHKQAHRGWLIGLYLLLLFAAPQVVSLVALLGWLDTWIDVRARLGGQA
ncbi:MAG: DUF2232 domain-containing protein [Gammaproteobacteria bacterium]